MTGIEGKKLTTLFYDARPCGSGKTYTEIADIIVDGGLHIYAVEKKEAMAEVESMIHRLAAKVGMTMRVERIYSRSQVPDLMPDGSLYRSGSANVKADIEALPGRYLSGNVIVLITHEGLKMADLSGFGNWSLTIDETPSIWDRQTINIALASMADHFAAHYGLKRLTDTSSEIVMRTGGDTVMTKAMAQDDMARAVSVLHARVLSDSVSVTTDLKSWTAILDGKGFTWSSIWSPEQLPIFRRVHVLANDFDHSVTFQIFRKRWPEIEWASLNRETHRRYAMRDVVIRYYAESHTASRGFWRTDTGQRHLRMIVMDLSRTFEPTSHIWMCNGEDEPLFRHPDPDEGSMVPGIKLSPRQQGSNKFMSVCNATMVYTSKPDKKDRAILREIGLDAQYVVDSREREPIVQFATRTSVRDAQSIETVTLTVYDREQAEHLARYFERTGYCRPTMHLVDLGLAYHVHESKSGRPKVVLTVAETKARDDKRREQARARKQAQRQRETEAKNTA